MLNYDPFGGDMETRIKTLPKKLFTGLYPTYTLFLLTAGLSSRKKVTSAVGLNYIRKESI
jgi:hypothetical protein